MSQSYKVCVCMGACQFPYLIVQRTGLISLKARFLDFSCPRIFSLHFSSGGRDASEGNADEIKGTGMQPVCVSLKDRESILMCVSLVGGGCHILLALRQQCASVN